MSVCVFAVIKLNLQEWRGTRGTLYKVLHERKVWESISIEYSVPRISRICKETSMIIFVGQVRWGQFFVNMTTVYILKTKVCQAFIPVKKV